MPTARHRRVRLSIPWHADLSWFQNDSFLSPYTELWAILAKRDTWPSPADLGDLANLFHGSSFPFAFVRQQPLPRRARSRKRRLEQGQDLTPVEEYVQHVVEQMVIPTREDNWHDLF